MRQTIIDLSIRGSGAELGPNAADLGRRIQAGVPLHMHQQLDDVFVPWFYFWKEEHWIAAQRRNNLRGKHGKQQYREEPSRNSGREELSRHVVTRFFLGCMSQPQDSIEENVGEKDSIEEYVGEKVAFYFTWHGITLGVFIGARPHPLCPHVSQPRLFCIRYSPCFRL